MKTSALSLAPSSARAQVVADGATNTLSNLTTNLTGDVTVGTNGSFTLLILSDNAAHQLGQRRDRAQPCGQIQ